MLCKFPAYNDRLRSWFKLKERSARDWKVRSTMVDTGDFKHELLNRLRSTMAVNVLRQQKDFHETLYKNLATEVPLCRSCYFSRVINKKAKVKHVSLQRHNTANWVFWSFHRFVVENYILSGYEFNLQTTILPISLNSDGMKIKNIRKTRKNDSLHTFLETLKASLSSFRTLLKS